MKGADGGSAEMGSRRRLRVDPVEPRAFGVPRRWIDPGSALGAAPLRHPLRWLRWRVAVHRLGPYAPAFTPGGRRGGDAPPEGFANNEQAP